MDMSFDLDQAMSMLDRRTSHVSRESLSESSEAPSAVGENAPSPVTWY